MRQPLRMLLVVLGLLPASCRTTTDLCSHRFPDLPGPMAVPDGPPTLTLLTDLLPPLPDHVIEDFEAGIGLWTIQTSKGSRADLTALPLTNGQAARLAFRLPRRRFKGIDPDAVTIRIPREEGGFERYTGIQFRARGSWSMPLRVVLYEHNRVAPDLVATELWTYEVEVGPEWRTFRIPFRRFEPEEYYEQSFIGNDRMEPTRIREVGFTVRNLKTLPDEAGELDLDDIILF